MRRGSTDDLSWIAFRSLAVFHGFAKRRSLRTPKIECVPFTFAADFNEILFAYLEVGLVRFGSDAEAMWRRMPKNWTCTWQRYVLYPHRIIEAQIFTRVWGS